MINPTNLKLKNIRILKNRYEVRISRKVKTEEEAILMKEFIHNYINSVNYYTDKINGGFIVKTYQGYKSVEDAMKVRDFLTIEIEKYKNNRQKEIEKQLKKNKSYKTELYENKITGQLSFLI